VFKWSSFDVRSILPRNWSAEILSVVRQHSRLTILQPPHSTSREAPDVRHIFARGVGPTDLYREVPWLVDLYQSTFRELAEEATGEIVTTGLSIKHTLVLNVQTADDGRYECHVDTNPIQGMLYVTSHPDGQGGELVVANTAEARTKEQIDANCSRVYPQAGHLVFFDARAHPHYVAPLAISAQVRVAVAMNFYTALCSESSRPDDLDDYLSGLDPAPTFIDKSLPAVGAEKDSSRERVSFWSDPGPRLQATIEPEPHHISH